jgi:glycosyltransferase involved in cell wall biosynthesis
MSLTRVSVIIPARDCRAYLGTALASVRAQAMGPMEVLVVDDGSTDGTTDWLETQRADWPSLRLLRTEAVGPNRARNAALALARAPLVAFLDADDRWLPGKLGPQLAWHERCPTTVLSFHDYRHVDEAGVDHDTCFAFWPGFHSRRGDVAYRPLALPVAALLAENAAGTSTVVARRDALRAVGGFDAALPSAADWDLWLRLARRGAVAVSGAVGSTRLMRRGSFSTDRGRRIRGMREIVARHGAAGSRSARAAAHARIAVAEAEAAAAAGRHGTAVLADARALGLRPSTRSLRELLAALARAASAPSPSCAPARR